MVLYPRLVMRFRNYTFLRADVVSPTLNPEPGGPGHPPYFFEVWYFSCLSGIHDKRKYNPSMHNFTVAIVNGSYMFRLHKIAIIRLCLSKVKDIYSRP
jgi:hypothetical protein